MVHPECQGHVSVCYGACYCCRTRVLYVNASLVRSGKCKIGPLASDDFDVLKIVVARFLKDFKRVPLHGIALIENYSEMPGIKMNGLDPDEPGSFQQKGVS